RHPFLLQAVLEKLWDSKERPDDKSIDRAGKSFLRDRSDVFDHWVTMLGADRCRIYQRILESDENSSISELRTHAQTENIDEGLRALSFHGVIDDSTDPDRPVINGTLFRDWFMRNVAAESNRGLVSQVAVPLARQRRFAVAFSFAGETRDRVKQ